MSGCVLTTTAFCKDQDWPQVGGEATEQHFSPLSSVNESTVGRLGLAWTFAFDTHRGQEATPIVVDGTMYVSSAWSKVYALDAATGQIRWSFNPEVPGQQAFHACCDVVNRGVAYDDGRVLVGTVDGRLIAINAKTGKSIWSVQTTDTRLPYSITGAPRIFKHRVIIGNAGGEYGVRGYVTAYDVRTGHQLWRFYTVPRNPAVRQDGVASDSALAKFARPTWFGHWYEYGGGGTVWDSIVYDAELDRIYFGVGNGSPWDRRVRSDGKGDNLFLGSVVAVDAATGAYKWHYQESPGESWDYDAAQPLVIATLTIKGVRRHVLMQASKNGFFYVLDRNSGELISAQNFVAQNWTDGIDLKTGRPRQHPNIFYDQPNLMMPGAAGGHNWQSMSFNPGTGMVYIPALEIPFQYSRDPDFVYRSGAWNTGVDYRSFIPPDSVAARKALRALAKGLLIAWDPIAQQERWRVTHDAFWNGGILTTAGNLVFQGDGDRQFNAYRADTGAKAWSFSASSGIVAAPVSYEIHGTQYIAVLSGWGGLVVNATEGDKPQAAPAGRILVFKLDGAEKLPDEAIPATKPANPTKEVFSASQVATGLDVYARNCAVCHGFGGIGGDIVPDLRRSSALSNTPLWRSIIIDGSLERLGMVSFRQYLSDTDVESVRAYINDRAQRLQNEERGLVLVPASDGLPAVAASVGSK